ncbi:MAG TPA: biotin/lipoyl-containing protein [Polyangiales bacterium]|nr:biotin/lipoyl-containing protein [Polyangiales bacterium]
MAKHRYVIDGKTFEVEVHARAAHTAEVSVNGRRYHVERADVGSATAERASAPSGPRPRRPLPGDGELRAPMAGLVLRLDVSPGQQLAAGDPVLVLDAMKMENAIRAPHAGVVREISVRAGDSVLTGALLARIDEA